MRVVILADEEMASRERDMLARMEIGLADEGVRVCHAVPRACLARDGEGDGAPSLGGQSEGGQAGPGIVAGLYSSVVGFDPDGLAITRASRVRRLAGDLARVLEGDDVRCIDLIHCFAAAPPGGVLGLLRRGLWTFAIDLARLTHARVLLEASGAGHIGPAASLISHNVAVVAGSGAGPQVASPPEFSAPGESIRRAILKRTPRARVHTVLWGVHSQARPRPRPERGAIEAERAGRPLSVVFLAGSSRCLHIGAAMEALARLTAGTVRTPPNRPPIDALIFAGAGMRLDHALTGLARRHGLTGRLCLVPDPESLREPVLESDLLIVADDEGRHRSFVLEAMARGMAVAAAADPLADDLIDGVTARLVNRPTAEAWSDALDPLMRSAADREALSATAAAHVRQRHSAAMQARALLPVYQSMIRGV